MRQEIKTLRGYRLITEIERNHLIDEINHLGSLINQTDRKKMIEVLNFNGGRHDELQILDNAHTQFVDELEKIRQFILRKKMEMNKMLSVRLFRIIKATSVAILRNISPMDI